MSFSAFGLHSTLLSAISEEGYSSPTPIQTQAIPLILAGKDLFGLAQTGTGKTAAFALPILNKYLIDPSKNAALTVTKITSHARKSPRCLVLAPTRELAMQVAESFSTYGSKTKLKVAVVYGGVGIIPQKMALNQNPEILVATPGRLLDLLEQRATSLAGVDTFVLDEADRMFDMGFIRDIRRVVAMLPTKRQTLLFSATMPHEIAELAKSILHNPERVEVTPAFRATDTVQQTVYFVGPKDRIALMKTLLHEQKIRRCIVFTRTKHVANRIAEALTTNHLTAEAFHSNKSQNARVRTLNGFKAGTIQVLVATDIAARGLDVENVEVVINYDLPEVPETYVHRIGRAGRAGKSGLAWSLCTAEQRDLLEDIERTTHVKPELISNHKHADLAAEKSLEAHLQFRQNPKHRSARPKAVPQQPKQRPTQSTTQPQRSQHRSAQPKPQHTSTKSHSTQNTRQSHSTQKSKRG